MTDNTLEWTRASVTADGTELALHVPFTGRPDTQWLHEFEGLRVSRHLQVGGTNWTVEPLGQANELTATRVVPGEETTIREALDELVALANARAGQVRAEEEAERHREPEELARVKQEASEMTERFRSLEPAPVRDEQEAVEPTESSFGDRLRVLSNGR
jgi:hypothetical protein